VFFAPAMAGSRDDPRRSSDR